VELDWERVVEAGRLGVVIAWLLEVSAELLLDGCSMGGARGVYIAVWAHDLLRRRQY
jgi:hypothetical protein